MESLQETAIKKIPFFFLIWAAINFVSSAGRNGTAEAKFTMPPGSKERAYAVTEVPSGDTLKLSNGDIVRLKGVDCPDFGDEEKNRHAAEELNIDFQRYDNFAEKAKEYLKALVKGAEVFLIYDANDMKSNHRDNEGHVLAYVMPASVDAKRRFADAQWTYMLDAVAGGHTPLRNLLNEAQFNQARQTSIEAAASQYDHSTDVIGSANDLIVMSGYCPVDTRASFQYQELLTSHQKVAESRGLGLWADPKTYIVSEVISGDVIKLDNGEMVRLLGVNSSAHKEYAEEAKRFVEELVKGRRVALVYDSNNKARNHRDEEGRLLAYVKMVDIESEKAYAVYINMRVRDILMKRGEDVSGFDQQIELIKKNFDRKAKADGTLLNSLIINEGFSPADTTMHLEKEKELVAFEKLAKEYKKGIWG